MIEARSDAVVPVTPAEAFAVVTDLEHADWVPAVRGLRLIGGEPAAVGARYAVEVGVVGRHLSGVLRCVEMEPPGRAAYVLEEGLELRITLLVAPVSGGASIELVARYGVAGGTMAGAMLERASAAPARREVARAMERLAARFGRRAPAPAGPMGTPRPRPGRRTSGSAG